MNQHQAGTAANPPGTGLEYRDPALSRPRGRAGWLADADVRAVDTARLLAADAVQKAGSGHPGTAMSLAPLAYLLFQQVLVHDPADDQWLGRDRFVLSAGHTSLTLYIQLFLSGYGLEIEDLRGAAHVGLQDPRAPGVPAYPRGGDHHRPARPGTRRGGRDGHGRAPGARAARPGGRARARARSTTTSTSSLPTAT